MVDVIELLVEDIWADPSFNCRGSIAPMDVLELSRNIEKHGLQQPISVRPLNDNPKYKYMVIIGHRRHKAFQVLKRETIPCIINSNISNEEALILNLAENVHRKNLNILQEAKALERLKLSGFTIDDVAKQIGKSTTWVRIRFLLLELPDVIREAAAAGYIKQTQIVELHKLNDFKKQVETAKNIKEAKIRGEKVPNIIRRKRDMFKKRPRERDDIFWMQTHIRESIGNNFGTRCLAWTAGEISDLDLYRDIQAIADKVGIKYKIPYDKSENK